jgi:hypothetical protein
MEVRTDGKDGSFVAPSKTVMDQFQEETERRQEQWERRLGEHPDSFADIEQEIDWHFRRGGGLLVASLLAEVTQEPGFETHVQEIRDNAAVALKAPEPRPLQVRLLCGLVLWISTLYCAPRRRPADKEKSERVVGLYPELAVLGFGKGCSPALQYKVARLVALSPSIEIARQELRREGIELDKKTVRRIAEQLGCQLLELRRRELFQWRAGLLPAGREFAGRRVAVQIDGGRTRLREAKKGKRNRRRKKGAREKFDTPWREPKALIIFEFDEHGKMVKKERQPLIDGTFLGPDHLVELVAFHLHRLGVADAESVVFISDGARWIWDRLEWIEDKAGLDPSRTTHVLDFCHAAHHISLALEALGLEGGKRRAMYVRLRKLLHQSRYEEVLSELIRLAYGRPIEDKVWPEIRYLRRHGDAGHLQYKTFRRRGLPCGSGAIESTIRRVINLRLKGNSIYWLQQNAEGIFAIRALLLCDRWEETLSRVRSAMMRDRRIGWRWTAPQLKKDQHAGSPNQNEQERQGNTSVAA